MKKRVIHRLLTGFPIGIAIGFVISIGISLIIQDGQFHPCPVALIESTGSEIRAVILQTALSGILGATFSAAALVWEIESWSLTKQTCVHFSVSAVTIGPFAYINNWMPHSWQGFFSFYLIFVVTFFVIWIVQYIVIKRRVQELNKLMR